MRRLFFGFREVWGLQGIMAMFALGSAAAKGGSDYPNFHLFNKFQAIKNLYRFINSY